MMLMIQFNPLAPEDSVMLRELNFTEVSSQEHAWSFKSWLFCRVRWALRSGATGLMKFCLGSQITPAIEEPLMYFCSVYGAKRMWHRKTFKLHTESCDHVISKPVSYFRGLWFKFWPKDQVPWLSFSLLFLISPTHLTALPYIRPQVLELGSIISRVAKLHAK